MVSNIENYRAAYQAIVDAHRAEMDKNLAEFHRQYGERVKKLEEIIQQAQKAEGASSTISKETTFATTRKGRHQAPDGHSTFAFGHTTTNGDSADNSRGSQATNSRSSHTPRTQGTSRGGGIRAIRS
ncbi:hypothetical protein [Corynebacterium pseudokroppenstedtii]|uniref:hypothetical protein n=1 Tax=Corynebacterium pseudokroppenstedtii TaxID=2804917 RepID=UPI003079BE6E